MSSLYRRYPRTKHLPSSRSRTDDDKIATEQDVLEAYTWQSGGNRYPLDVVITEKMDGENTTIYADGHSHARSIDSKFHPSRSIVRELTATIAHDLPPTFRVCGENIFAVHSIEYKALKSHFQVFSIWDGDRCLSWDETLDWCGLLSLNPVPVIYRGAWRSETDALERWILWKAEQEDKFDQTSEGFVIRPSGEFKLEDFGKKVMKYVRPKHVQSGTHWLHEEMKVNSLRFR